MKTSVTICILLTIGMLGMSGCGSNSTSSGGHGHYFHNGHYHISEINHNHSTTYNTPCGQSHGHCN